VLTSRLQFIVLSYLGFFHLTELLYHLTTLHVTNGCMSREHYFN